MANNEGDTSEAAAVKKRARRRPAKRGVAAKMVELLTESFPKLTKLLKLARDWTQRRPLWIRVPLYLLLIVGAVIYSFGDSLLKLPLLASIRGEIVNQMEDLFAVPLPKASGKEFAIAVARIENDDGSVGRSLAIALKISGVERLQIDRRLRFVEAANLDAAEAAAHETVRRWLEKSQADLLLWGQTIPGDPPGVRLIMTPRSAQLRQEAQVPQRYLAFNFLEETREPFEAAVQAQVLGFLAQFDSSRAVAEQLRQAIARLERIVRSRKEGPGRGALVFALANARATLGEQAGDTSVLMEAVTTYQELLDARSRETVPLDWAMTQNNLGNALCSLGTRERGTGRLEEAVNAYRAALEENTLEKVPLNWAMTQNNLGYALESLGRRGSEPARLEEAIRAYRAALTKFRLETEPFDWATTQNNLGNVLVALGELEGGTARLTEAVEAFRVALKVRSREKTPLSWAMTQSNLGNALGVLGEREKSTARLKEAVAAYREALKEYTVEKVPLDWSMTHYNLGIVLRSLGALEEGTAHLKEAVASFRAALDKRAREKAPLSWAMTQKNLGDALRSLGERENGTGHFEEAITAYQAALEEYTKERAPLEWAMMHNYLGEALRILAGREKSLRRVEEAIRMFDDALSVPELKLSSDRRIVQENFWEAGAFRATLVKGLGSER